MADPRPPLVFTASQSNVLQLFLFLSQNYWLHSNKLTCCFCKTQDLLTEVPSKDDRLQDWCFHCLCNCPEHQELPAITITVFLKRKSSSHTRFLLKKKKMLDFWLLNEEVRLTYSSESGFQALKQCEVSDKTLYTWHFLLASPLQPLSEYVVLWPHLKRHSFSMKHRELKYSN